MVGLPSSPRQIGESALSMVLRGPGIDHWFRPTLNAPDEIIGR
jgi:hypothetical protein